MIIGISGKKGSGKDTVCKIIQYLIYNHIYASTPVDIPLALANPNAEVERLAVSTRWEKKAFATKLKTITSMLTGLTFRQLEDEKDKEIPLGEEWDCFLVTDPYSGLPKLYKDTESIPAKDKMGAFKRRMTPRRFMQLLGTEFGRNMIHPDIWVNALLSEYAPHEQIYGGHGNILVEDNNWIITDVRFENEAIAIKKKEGILLRIERLRDYPCRKCGKPEIDHYADVKLTENDRVTYVVEEGYTRSADHNYISSEDKHASETELDGYPLFDYTINNYGSIEDLISNVEKLLQALNIIQKQIQ